MALAIHFDCYAVTGRDVKDERPAALKNNAVPFFEVALRCYYEAENGKNHARIEECDKRKVAELRAAGYEDCVVYDASRRSVKHRYLRKTSSERIRSSDGAQLVRQLLDGDSEFWQFMKEEIARWREIVCGI